MSARAVAWVRENWRGRSAGQRFMLFLLAEHYDDEAGEVRIKRADLAAEYGANGRSVFAVVDSLVAAGLVVVDRAHGRAARYRLVGMGQEATHSNGSGTNPFDRARDGSGTNPFTPAEWVTRPNAPPLPPDPPPNAGDSPSPTPPAPAVAGLSVTNPFESEEDGTVSETKTNIGPDDEEATTSVFRAQFRQDEEATANDNGTDSPAEVMVTSARARARGVPSYAEAMASWDVA